MAQIKTLHAKPPVKGKTFGEWTFHLFQALTLLFLLATLIGEGAWGGDLQAGVLMAGLRALFSFLYSLLFSGAILAYFTLAMANFLAFAGIFLLFGWIGHRVRERAARRQGKRPKRFEPPLYELYQSFRRTPNKGRLIGGAIFKSAGALACFAGLLAAIAGRLFFAGSMTLLVCLTLLEEISESLFASKDDLEEAPDGKKEAFGLRVRRQYAPNARRLALLGAGAAVSLAAGSPAPALWSAALPALRAAGLRLDRLFAGAKNGGKLKALAGAIGLLLAMLPAALLQRLFISPSTDRILQQPGVTQISERQMTHLAAASDGSNLFGLVNQKTNLVRFWQDEGEAGSQSEFRERLYTAPGAEELSIAGESNLLWISAGRKSQVNGRLLGVDFSEGQYRYERKVELTGCWQPGQVISLAPWQPTLILCRNPARAIRYPGEPAEGEKAASYGIKSLSASTAQIDYSPKYGVGLITNRLIGVNLTALAFGGKSKEALIDWRSPALAVAVHDRRRLAYVSQPLKHNIQALDLAELKVWTNIPSPRFVSQLIVLDGPNLLAAVDAARGDVEFIDLTTHETVGRLLTGLSTSAALAPEAQKLFFASQRGVFSVDLPEFFASKD